MAMREPLTSKQKIVCIATGAVLWIPLMTFIIMGRDSVTPRQFAAVGLVNLLVMVPLFAFITEKWIRKIK
jgi:hypothetical protein